MVWLSDVQKGGATCFTYPDEEGTVSPRKNSALFWIDMDRRLARDQRLLHGGCPVLLGTKWILNNWIYSFGQWRSWSCGMDTNAEFNVYNHFMN